MESRGGAAGCWLQLHVEPQAPRSTPDSRFLRGTVRRAAEWSTTRASGLSRGCNSSGNLQVRPARTGASKSRWTESRVRARPARPRATSGGPSWRRTSRHGAEPLNAGTAACSGDVQLRSVRHRRGGSGGLGGGRSAQLGDAARRRSCADASEPSARCRATVCVAEDPIRALPGRLARASETPASGVRSRAARIRAARIAGRAAALACSREELVSAQRGSVVARRPLACRAELQPLRRGCIRCAWRRLSPSSYRRLMTALRSERELISLART